MKNGGAEFNLYARARGRTKEGGGGGNCLRRRKVTAAAAMAARRRVKVTLRTRAAPLALGRKEGRKGESGQLKATNGRRSAAG